MASVALVRRIKLKVPPAIRQATGLLAAAGVIDALPHGAETCYRLCGAGHHHHLVCSECHRVVELTDCRLGGWLARASAAEGFLVTDHTLEAVGLCASCRS